MMQQWTPKWGPTVEQLATVRTLENSATPAETFAALSAKWLVHLAQQSREMCDAVGILIGDNATQAARIRALAVVSDWHCVADNL